MTDRSPTLRIVAGTDAAVRLAEAAATAFGEDLQVAVALSGIAAVPRGCRIDRIGPFGSGVGTTDLDGAAVVIDGLDPFDRGAVRALREAAVRAGVPRLAFRPPVWQRHPLDRWVEVRDLAGAAGAVASVAQTVLLAVPERDLPAFEPVAGLRFPVRLARSPARWERPARFEPVACPPPRCREAEIRLLRRVEAGAVVMRATGCAADRPLVEAARAVDLPVVMIRRPVERGEVPARTVEVALDWVAAALTDVIPRRRDVPAWR